MSDVPAKLPALPAPFTSRSDLLTGDQNYLQKLQQDPSITDEQWAKLEQYFMTNVSSPIQPSIICKDAGCPYINSCALYQAGIERPLGKPCVIEETVKRNWLGVYLPEVGNSPDGYHVVDTGMVIDLVSTLLDIHRAQGEVADMPNVAERVLRGYDNEGNAITDLKMNPLHFYLGNARKLKMKILEQLVATRDARKKDKSRTTQDMTQLLSEMRATITTLARQKSDLEEQLQAVAAREAQFIEHDAAEDGDDADPTSTP